MNIKQLLEDLKIEYLKRTFLDNKDSEVLINPNDSTVSKIKTGKFLADKKTKTLYVWADTLLFHKNIMNHFKLKEDENILKGYLSKGKITDISPFNLNPKINWNWTNLKDINKKIKEYSNKSKPKKRSYY